MVVDGGDEDTAGSLPTVRNTVKNTYTLFFLNLFE